VVCFPLVVTLATGEEHLVSLAKHKKNTATDRCNSAALATKPAET